MLASAPCKLLVSLATPGSCRYIKQVNLLLVGCWKSAQEPKEAWEQRGQRGQPDRQRVALASPCWDTSGCKDLGNPSQLWAGAGHSNLSSQQSEAEGGSRRASLAGNCSEQPLEPVCAG